MNKEINLCFSTLGCAERDLEGIISLAERYGIHRIELRGISGEIRLDAIPELSEASSDGTRRLFEEKGIIPTVLGTSVCFHDEAGYAAKVREGKSAIDIAERIGAPYIRVFGDRITSEKTVERVIDGLTELAEYAEGKGVIVLLEVHGDFNTEASLSPITEALDGFSSFGILWDVCHTHETYGAGWHEFYSRFAPFIRHIHIKDIKDGVHVLPGDGEIPLRDMIERLAKDGYSGCFSLEWEKKWHPELPDIETALERMIALCKTV